MGKVEPLTIIDDPSAWLARDYPDPAAYAYQLSPADIAELDAAVATASAAVAAGKEVQVRRLACSRTVACNAMLRSTVLRGRISSHSSTTRLTESCRDRLATCQSPPDGVPVCCSKSRRPSFSCQRWARS